MTNCKIRPYGSWHSEISADLIVAESVGIGQIRMDGDDLYWTEVRPAESGRTVLVRSTIERSVEDITPSPYSVRSRVHEYGGGAFLVVEGTVYFINDGDQRLYCQMPGREPVALTVDVPMRYADLEMDDSRKRLICVREDHTAPGEPVNAIVAIPIDGGDVEILEQGKDFYAAPRVSTDGTTLAWLSWNHPNMPWDGNCLWVASFSKDHKLSDPKLIAGEAGEAICQPEWSPSGVLYFVSDQSGWWNIYSWQQSQIKAVLPMEAEFGVPLWQFGVSLYGFCSDGKIVCSYSQNGVWHIGMLNPENPVMNPVETEYTDVSRSGIRVGDNVVAFGSGSATESRSVVKLNLATGQHDVIRKSSAVQLGSEFFSKPQSIQFKTDDGKSAHGFFYPPHNPDFTAPLGEKPPLIVLSHGGPTAATSPMLDMDIQFWTSRGFAVLDVNYRGSSGYGTSYRRALEGQWGVADVDDCVYGALYLVNEGLVDEDRLIIRGSSAGGYTTLSALTFRETFKVGASHYGIGDLEALATDTHKFESRYLDSLIGPYPECRKLYEKRSPINYVERLSVPVILFQGLDDMVVPPIQAERMAGALKEKGIPVAYVPLKGEGHGFRDGDNIKMVLESELFFFSIVLGFDLSEDINPIPIENLRTP